MDRITGIGSRGPDLIRRQSMKRITFSSARRSHPAENGILIPGPPVSGCRFVSPSLGICAGFQKRVEM